MLSDLRATWAKKHQESNCLWARC